DVSEVWKPLFENVFHTVWLTFGLKAHKGCKIETGVSFGQAVKAGVAIVIVVRPKLVIAGELKIRPTVATIGLVTKAGDLVGNFAWVAPNVSPEAAVVAFTAEEAQKVPGGWPNQIRHFGASFHLSKVGPGGIGGIGILVGQLHALDGPNKRRELD